MVAPFFPQAAWRRVKLEEEADETALISGAEGWHARWRPRQRKSAGGVRSPPPVRLSRVAAGPTTLLPISPTARRLSCSPSTPHQVSGDAYLIAPSGETIDSLRKLQRFLGLESEGAAAPPAAPLALSKPRRVASAAAVAAAAESADSGGGGGGGAQSSLSSADGGMRPLTNSGGPSKSPRSRPRQKPRQ